MKRAPRPGKIGEHKLGVYDGGAGRLRGQVGPLATARFHGQHGSTIQVVNGRKAWVAPNGR